MTTSEAYALPAHVEHFFAGRLITQMEASVHTVGSYRDTFIYDPPRFPSKRGCCHAPLLTEPCERD